MCFAYDAQPPEPPGAADVVPGTPLTLTSADGTEFAAFRAEAAPPSGAGVVILPDIRGLFAFYERLAERFASVGIDAVAIDYFGRTAGVSPRGDDFDFRPHVSQTTPAGVAADTAAAVAHLRERRRVEKIFVVGFCFGGSNAFLQASNTDLAGVVGFYGGMRPRVEGGPTPISEAPRSAVPVLGLFGGADTGIPAEQIEAFGAGLSTAGVEHTLHVYPGAPHSFFDRSYDDYTDQCADAWRRVLAFIEAHG
ncbi:dienelactone hydrolase family protein [Actinopolymorpha alba]|uniref:dienelactone hydrolase family protein n=1 Tax=Actinopolymorpha alba TaxID=533267 RepID=UPI0003657413|nr:dienelactone hydrolase family protein [Actinopolymorpha alba]